MVKNPYALHTSLPGGLERMDRIPRVRDEIGLNSMVWWIHKHYTYPNLNFAHDRGIFHWAGEAGTPRGLFPYVEHIWVQKSEKMTQSISKVEPTTLEIVKTRRQTPGSVLEELGARLQGPSPQKSSCRQATETFYGRQALFSRR